MNVSFRFGEERLNALFLECTAAAGFCGLNGHRALGLGGIRASRYNAVTETAASHLSEFLDDFTRRHG